MKNKLIKVKRLPLKGNEKLLTDFWRKYITDLLEDAQYEKIFVACVCAKIVGCAMLLDEKDIRWSKNFSGRTGGIGCIGVIKH